MKKLKPLEKPAVEKPFVRKLAKLGFTSQKLQILGSKGWADQLVLGPNRFVAFVELKRPGGGDVSAHQEEVAEFLTELNHFTGIFDNADEAVAAVQGWYREHLKDLG